MQFFTAGSQILNSPDAKGEVLANVAEARNIEYPGKVDGMKMILLLQIFVTGGLMDKKVLAAKNQIRSTSSVPLFLRPPSCHVVHLLPTQVKVCPGYCFTCCHHLLSPGVHPESLSHRRTMGFSGAGSMAKNRACKNVSRGLRLLVRLVI